MLGNGDQTLVDLLKFSSVIYGITHFQDILDEVSICCWIIYDITDTLFFLTK